MAELDVTRIVRSARTNLRRRLARRPIAFVLSGGGSQGSFEVGVLRYLYDDLNVRPAILVGSSVGAIIAAKLAEGDDEESGTRAIDELEDIWRGLASNSDMWLTEPWLDKLRSQVTWASELRGRAGEHGTVGSQARVVMRMLGEIVRNPPEADGTVDALRQAMRAKSLLRMDPVRAIVEGSIDPARVAASGLTLRVGAVSLESGELHYVDELGRMSQRDGTPIDREPVSLHDAVLASASIPVVFPPTRVGDETYVDGGVREILPLSLAFGRLGAGHIFAVVASAPGVDEWADASDRGLFDIARRVTADIGPDEILRKEIDPPRGWGRPRDGDRARGGRPRRADDRSRADRGVDRLRLHARRRRPARSRRRAVRTEHRHRADARPPPRGARSGPDPAPGGRRGDRPGRRRRIAGGPGRGGARDLAGAGAAAGGRGRAAAARQLRGGDRAGQRAPRMSRPGRAPVSSPCSNVTSPATTVAT